jgi:hypothetical protein
MDERQSSSYDGKAIRMDETIDVQEEPSKLPKLPKIPRLKLPLISLPLKPEFDEASVRQSENASFSKLVAARRGGKALALSSDRDMAFVNINGCRMCPWYGTSFCYEGVVPPNVFLDRGTGLDGICRGRVNELLDVAELYEDADGLVIRKREAAERIRKHILLLEANLSEYRVKRLGFIPKSRELPLDAANGETKESRELLISQFDDYEQQIMKQVQFLSLKYAEFLQGESKLDVKDEKDVRVISPLDVGRLIRQSKVVDVND